MKSRVPGTPISDVDLTLESIKHPERYLLASKRMSNKPIKHTSDHA